MTVMILPDIDDRTRARLHARATMNGRSIEEEARDILRSALSTEDPPPLDLGRAIHARFAAFGGVDLPDIPREGSREPPDFAV